MSNVVNNLITDLELFIKRKANNQPRTEIEMLIEHACHPSRPEPDLATNLEICDVINTSTRLSTPREAAVELLYHINSRDQREALLALSLLDICVKNCGYPFHLQIASKDFLNELVRRFPERAPMVKTPVQERILDLIQQWNSVLYAQSKYKNDLIHINDMFRLLTYKGYRFPTLKKEAEAVLKPLETFQTKEELEKEDRQVQNARLQELLRKGTPADLKAANELMKVMAGYDFEKQPDYEKKAEDELSKLDDKASMLVEILTKLESGKSVTSDSGIQELVAAIKTSLPKIGKWVEEEAGEDDVRVAQLLAVNDHLNDALNMYEQKKNTPSQQVSAPPSYQPSSSVQKPQQESLLIDFEGGSEPTLPTAFSPPVSFSGVSPSPAPQQNTTDLLGELSDISFNSVPAPSGMASIRLESTNTAFWRGGQGAGPSTMSPPTNYMPFSSPSMTVQQSLVNQQQQPMSQFLLDGPAPMDLNFTASSPPSYNAVRNIAPANLSEAVMYEKNGIRISISSVISGTSYQSTCFFSNLTNATIQNLVFQVAVPTYATLQMMPLSSNVLAPMSTKTLQQSFTVMNPTKAPLKIRFRLSFSYNNMTKTDQGEFSQFPLMS